MKTLEDYFSDYLGVILIWDIRLVKEIGFRKPSESLTSNSGVLIIDGIENGSLQIF